MATCLRCKITYSKSSSLRAHVKYKHPDELDILAPLKRTKSNVSDDLVDYLVPLKKILDVPCLECNKKFISVGNMRFHMRTKHPAVKLVPLQKKKYTCSNCEKQFDVLKHLIVHRRIHKSQAKLKCPVCEFCGTGRENLIDHFENEHFFSIKNENLQFDTFEDFQLWKSEVEEESYSFFINRYGQQTKAHYSLLVFTCHRSGVFRQKGKNIRRVKAKGSNKIGGYCPARIIVKINNENGSCEVQFCKSHIGHKQKEDIEHLPLSKHHREVLAVNIAAKIPFKEILDEVRESGTDDRTERLDLLTKKDLHNLKQGLNLNDDKNDAESTDDMTLQEAKTKLIMEVTQIINDTRTLDELNIIKNKLIAVKLLFSTKKKSKSRKQDLDEPTSEGADDIAGDMSVLCPKSGLLYKGCKTGKSARVIHKK